MSDPEQRAQEAAAEFMRTVPVQDVIVSMVQTVFDVGYRRTGMAGGDDVRDLDQARLSIETVRALLPVLEQVLEPASTTALRSALSELQMAYARAAEAGPAQGAEAAPAQPPHAQPQTEQPPPAREGVVPERPRIWTPGGDV
jgi:hypothetical protein